MTKLPRVELCGQTTAELIACKNTHRIGSILAAFEWGIQAKIGPGGEQELTSNERLVLAVMALLREVNNGGYHQFFINSSRRFAPVIVENLQLIGCATTAEITERAISALGVDSVSGESVSEAAAENDLARNKVLDKLDMEFYQINEVEPQLFKFIEAHQDNIQLVKGSKPPFELKLPKRSNASRLCTHLTFTKLQGLTLDELRQSAREVARQKSIDATEADIEAALSLYRFERSLRAGDMAACEALAPRAFELMRDDTMHCVHHKQWVLRLIEKARFELADRSTLYYLEYLKTCDQSALKTQNSVLFWAAPIQENRAVLPKSAAFFKNAFPELDLDAPLPVPYPRVPSPESRQSQSKRIQ